jgi:hypothetical protein
MREINHLRRISKRAVETLSTAFLILPFTSIVSRPFAQAALSGPKRPTTTYGTREIRYHNLEITFFAANSSGEKNLSGTRRYQAVLAGTTRHDDRLDLRASRRLRPLLSFVCFCGISLGPTTRQYPAIPGNMRTKDDFLAAYCRITVRVLPHNRFSCRIKSAPRQESSARPEGPPRLF